MEKTLSKNISFIIGGIAIFIAGILYVLLADWILTTQSLWLMLAIVLSVGSAVCAILSEKFKGRREVMFALKSVAIFLSMCLIAFFVTYLCLALAPAKEIDPDKEMNVFIKSFTIKSVYDDAMEIGNTLIVFIIVLVINMAGLIGQVLDLAFTATIKEE